jgi:D-glycero-alpha-D-manno-heptose 1-phosphate guanylyltransferase
MSSISQTDVLILCGGLGTRFREVMSDRPKGLAPVAGKPILEILIDDFAAQGAKRIILCIGHMKEQIVDYFSNRNDVDIAFSEEVELLGTGGAIINAIQKIQTDQVLISNGDSLCKINYNDMCQFHASKKSCVTIAVSPTANPSDYGNIKLDSSDKIISFEEKVSSEKKALISAGIYIMSVKEMNDLKKQFPISLENDIFPSMIKKQNCFGFLTDKEVMDIGTVKRYHDINRKLQNELYGSVCSKTDS